MTPESPFGNCSCVDCRSDHRERHAEGKPSPQPCTECPRDGRENCYGTIYHAAPETKASIGPKCLDCGNGAVPAFGAGVRPDDPFAPNVVCGPCNDKRSVKKAPETKTAACTVCGFLGDPACRHICQGKPPAPERKAEEPPKCSRCGKTVAP